MTPSTSQAHPAISPEAMALLADGVPTWLPSRERRVHLLEEALDSLEQLLPCLELRMGQLLAPLLKDGHRHLSYVTPAVFCREELGISATTARELVRLAQGLPGRPILLKAFLEDRLSRTHALELLKIGPEDDAAWVRQARDLTVPELRKALKPLLPIADGESTGGDRVVRTYELDAEAYSTWLTVTELARRREGRDLGGDAVLEQVLAELAASRSASAIPDEPRLLPCAPSSPAKAPAPGSDGPRPFQPDLQPERADEASTPDLVSAGIPPFQRDPAWAGKPATPTATPACSVDPATETSETEGIDAPLPPLLLEEIPRSPRKLTRMAVRCLCLREQTELHRARVLRRIQQGRLYRDLGHADFRSWLRSRGLCPSTVFQATARDERLERQPRIRQALLQGVLSATKADMLLRLPAHADLGSWIAYGQVCTCRRLEEVVEAALVLAARFPAAWARRGRTAPGEEETLLEFRQQAGLVSLETALDDLARAFEDASASGTQPGSASGSVQTSAPASAPAAGRASASPEVQTSAQGPAAAEASPRTIRLRLSLPNTVGRMLAAAEEDLRRDAGRHLTPDECLHVLLLLFLRLVGQEEQPELRGLRRTAFERAGYRCEVPGCSCRTNLHLHHLLRRSQGGRDELGNLAVLCASHHLRHVHGGTMRVEGEEPETRIWDLGLDEDGMPWRTYVDERLVDGAALLEETEPDGAALLGETEPDGAALLEGEDLDRSAHGATGEETARGAERPPEAVAAEWVAQPGDADGDNWPDAPTPDDRVCEASPPYGSTRPAA